MKKLSKFLLVFLLAVLAIPMLRSQEFTKYLDPGEINDYLIKLNSEHAGQTKISNLAQSAGGRDLKMLEIGAEAGSTVKTNPAVLVVANLDGDVPFSSLGALDLARRILDEGQYQEITWYIIPSGNPDAAMRYFNGPLYQDGRNDLPHNDDLDEQTDEDGFDDLDGNRFITKMRVKDPAGEWIVLEGEPRMMRKADPVKGEKGVYKLYTEGLDNDGDGKYNEDGPGGVNVNINFPHLFKPHTASGGLWPGSVDESFGLLKFAYEHPEIAMTISFGSTNFCLVPPKGGRKGSADMNSLKVPKSYSDWLGADPDKTYTMNEVIELVKAVMPPGREVTESMVASILGLGAMVNPLPADLMFYKEISDKYKNQLEEQGFKDERLDPAPAKDGSFELWAYYHLGVPSFSMNLWTLPKAKEEKKEGSELSKEKRGNPAEKSGGDPKMKALLAFSDKNLEGKGFTEWKTFQHPTLGEVEIGGTVPFTYNTPPPEMIDSLLKLQVPYLLDLTGYLPKLSLGKTKVTPKEGGVYQLEVWVQNDRLIPFPTAMGEKNKQPAPAVILIDADDIQILSGKERTPVNKVGAYKAVKQTWLIQADKPTDIKLTLTSKSAWGDEKQIRLGGAK